MPTALREQGHQNTGSQGSGNLHLDDSVQFLKGVGRPGALILNKLGLFTVEDLLRHIPRRWDDRTRFRKAADVMHGETVSLHGIASSVETKRPKPKITVTEVILNDGGSPLKLVWFNQPYMERLFAPLVAAKKSVVVYGQIKRNGWTPEIQN